MSLSENFVGAGIVCLAVYVGEGGIEGLGDSLEAVVDLPGDSERALA